MILFYFRNILLKCNSVLEKFSESERKKPQKFCMVRFSWMVTVIIMLFSTISPLTEGKSPRVNSFLAMLVCHCGWCGWDFCHPPKSPRDERCVIWATGFACQSTLSFSFPPTEDSISPLKPSLLITMQNDQR